MGSSNRWATTISSTASSLYFLIILFQIPLFRNRVRCRGTLCTTPLELTCSQLLASEVFRPSVVKGVLYPGAIAKAIFNNKPIPPFNSLPKLYKFIQTPSPLTSDLHRLEVIAGSYLAVGGGIMGMVRAGGGRMSLFGCLITMWGIVWRKSSYLNPNKEKEISQIYPTMFLVLLLAFLSVRKDVRRILIQWLGGKQFSFRVRIFILLLYLSKSKTKQVERWNTMNLLIILILALCYYSPESYTKKTENFHILVKNDIYYPDAIFNVNMKL
uniref:Transmembrane protein n=1 Tax=Cucumis melo TaxID=3656 RepID=A0A9I9E607_CUCME